MILKLTKWTRLSLKRRAFLPTPLTLVVLLWREQTAASVLITGLYGVSPKIGTSADGIVIDPSLCCPFSTTATSVRPTANPDPFKVCSNSGLPSPDFSSEPAYGALGSL